MEHPEIVWRNPVIKHMDGYSQQMAYIKSSPQFRLGCVAKCVLEKENDSFSDFFGGGAHGPETDVGFAVRPV